MEVEEQAKWLCHIKHTSSGGPGPRTRCSRLPGDLSAPIRSHLGDCFSQLYASFLPQSSGKAKRLPSSSSLIAVHSVFKRSTFQYKEFKRANTVTLRVFSNASLEGSGKL